MMVIDEESVCVSDRCAQLLGQPFPAGKMCQKKKTSNTHWKDKNYFKKCFISDSQHGVLHKCTMQVLTKQILNEILNTETQRFYRPVGWGGPNGWVGLNSVAVVSWYTCGFSPGLVPFLQGYLLICEDALDPEKQKSHVCRQCCRLHERLWYVWLQCCSIRWTVVHTVFWLDDIYSCPVAV